MGNSLKIRKSDDNGAVKTIPKFKCFRIQKDKKGNFDMDVETNDNSLSPSHLIIMVNGIVGSASDWKYAAEQFIKANPKDVIVHCSNSNALFYTFDGIDVMGSRLAAEVISVIKRYPSVQKISFVSHSLGGLVARYAIAELYRHNLSSDSSQEHAAIDGGNFEEKIAGLKALNFITCGTPHLGSRWHKQVPMFCGNHTLETVAVHASWFLGRTGHHLFLTDTDNGKPLLLRMTTDFSDLKFISALQLFKRRVVYANARSDYIVGWSTSSLRSRNALPKEHNVSRDDKYPHIQHIEKSTRSFSDGFPADTKHSIEDEMLRNLVKLNWERVDVNFGGGVQRFLAHTTLQVKHRLLNSAGTDVIQHMIDNFLF